jgi:hypothetical protein
MEGVRSIYAGKTVDAMEKCVVVEIQKEGYMQQQIRQDEIKSIPLRELTNQGEI